MSGAPATETRSVVLLVRLTVAERAALRKTARAAGMTVSAYVRLHALTDAWGVGPADNLPTPAGLVEGQARRWREAIVARRPWGRAEDANTDRWLAFCGTFLEGDDADFRDLYAELLLTRAALAEARAAARK